MDTWLGYNFSMNRFFTLLLAASCLTAVGQVTYPYNPDGNADTLIGVTDLQDLLVVYGNSFSPSEILVQGETLTSLLTQLQNSIDSLGASSSTNGTATSHLFNQSWGLPQGTVGQPQILCLSSGDEYEVPAGQNLYVYMAKDFGCSNQDIEELYGGWVDNWQIHTTSPSGFNNLGFGPGTRIKHYGCEHYVLYGFLCPEVEWLSHELFLLAPGETKSIPPQSQFWAGIIEGNYSTLSFDVTPECAGQPYWGVDQPYATGGSHLWSGSITNNSEDDFIVAYGYMINTNNLLSETNSELGEVVDSLELRIQQLEDLLSLINFGCTDPTACNYSADVDIDNGSCEGLFGCTDPLSNNYNAAATCDDGTCLPYVGMVDYGGIVYSVDNGTARVLNIVEELSAGSETTSCYNAVGTLNSTTGSEGFSDWTLPSQNDWASICQEYNLVNLLNFINGGLSLDGVFIVNQQAYSSGNSYYFSCRTPGEGSCNTSPGTDYQVCPSATIRLVRSFSFED